jgi:hypothetical protein
MKQQGRTEKGAGKGEAGEALFIQGAGSTDVRPYAHQAAG